MSYINIKTTLKCKIDTQMEKDYLPNMTLERFLLWLDFIYIEKEQVCS